MGGLVLGVWRCVAMVCCAVLWRSVVWRLCAAVMCVAAVLVCRWAPFVVFLIVAHLFVCVCGVVVGCCFRTAASAEIWFGICFYHVLCCCAGFGRRRLLGSGLMVACSSTFTRSLLLCGDWCSFMGGSARPLQAKNKFSSHIQAGLDPKRHIFD